MGCGASVLTGQAPASDVEARPLGMPSTLPPAYVCIFCSDITCRCRCLYCGAVGHSTKLCERRLKHGYEAGSTLDTAAPAGFAPRAHVHVRYSRAIDDQPTQVASKQIQSAWRGKRVRLYNRNAAPQHNWDWGVMDTLTPYGDWVRCSCWALLAFSPDPVFVRAATKIQALARGWKVRRRNEERTREQVLAALHRDVWRIKLWAAAPTPAWHPHLFGGSGKAPSHDWVEVSLAVGPDDGEVRVILDVSPELLELSRLARVATHIQKMFRGYITRKWQSMMGAMMMLPGQGGIDAAVEKYGFRVNGLLQELQRRIRKLGMAHPDTADVLYNLGRLYQQHGDFKEALGVFNKALRTYTQILGTGHAKTANLLYCIALIYKERAEGDSETAQIQTVFQRADKAGTGAVEMEALEPLLGKLFDGVDLSLCSGPQTVVALLLEVAEGADMAEEDALTADDFSIIYRRCLMVVAEGYFRTAARGFLQEFGAEYPYYINAKLYAGEEGI